VPEALEAAGPVLLAARLLEGEGAGEPGQWASSMLTGGGAGPRAAREQPGQRRRDRGGRA
jgi:hypothetical protein